MSEGNSQAVGKSVYFFNVKDGNAYVTRVPFDEKDDAGATLVRTSEIVVHAIVDKILDDAGYSDRKDRARKSLSRDLSPDVRKAVRGGEAFTTTVIELKMPEEVEPKSKGRKDKDAAAAPVHEPVVDEEEVDDAGDEVEPVAQSAY